MRSANSITLQKHGYERRRDEREACSQLEWRIGDAKGCQASLGKPGDGEEGDSKERFHDDLFDS